MNDLATIAPDQLELIRRTVAKDATNDELQLFIYDCQRRGVHPLDKLLHFTKRKGKYTPITSIDLFRIQAGQTGLHGGTDDAVFQDNEQGELIKATVTVYKIVAGMRCPTTASARWGEYYPGDGADGFMWRKMPHTMLAKCAEALALRKAFPQELGGLYTADEMDQAGTPRIVDAEPVTAAEKPAEANPAPAKGNPTTTAAACVLAKQADDEAALRLVWDTLPDSAKNSQPVRAAFNRRKYDLRRDQIDALCTDLGLDLAGLYRFAQQNKIDTDAMDNSANADIAQELIDALKMEQNQRVALPV